jgi:hypothetical protein
MRLRLRRLPMTPNWWRAATWSPTVSHIEAVPYRSGDLPNFHAYQLAT